jgi:hypothetical protein
MSTKIAIVTTNARYSNSTVMPQIKIKIKIKIKWIEKLTSALVYIVMGIND